MNNSLLLFAGNFAPLGWIRCQGQVLSIKELPGLFAVIGTAYGGDGVTTFQAPDFTNLEKELSEITCHIFCYLKQFEDFKIDYLGTIIPTNQTEESGGMMVCDGRLLKIEEYVGLFQLCGIKYGGDGVTNFALPDLRKAAAKNGVTYMIVVDGLYPSGW